jgi:hypothetical protein
MIVTRVTVNFPEACWRFDRRSSKQTMERTTTLSVLKPVDDVARMSLESLLYYVLVGEGAVL